MIVKSYMKLIRSYLPVILVMNLSFCGIVQPQNAETIFRRHVLLEWEQEPAALGYHLQVSDDSQYSNLIHDLYDSTLIHIVTDGIDWNDSYYWRVAPVYADASQGGWSEGNFIVGQPASEASSQAYLPDQVTPGITIFGAFFNNLSAAIDENGEEIWNAAPHHIIYYNMNQHGQFFGARFDNSLEHSLPSLEFNTQLETVWEEPNEVHVHHEFTQLPNGNYMGISTVTQPGPIPQGTWTSLFQAIGYVADGVTPEFTWVGDRLVEWDAETGEEVWSWNVFDHFSSLDFDALGGTWEQSFFAGSYDWTHMNAFWFSEEESAVYISVRHLSRITKISYPDGSIIWNMGMEMPSGDVDCGHELGYSFQHSIEVTDDHTIVTFDNGNLNQTSRALEIGFSDDGGGCSAEIVWEYTLPAELFGLASGNLQKLSSGNYLVTTVGGGGTSLEITPDFQIAWEGNYNLTLPNGAIYRASRIPGLYPVALNFTAAELDTLIREPVLNLTIGASSVTFNVHNEGCMSETFDYEFTCDGDWFPDSSGTVEILAESSVTFTFPGFTVENAPSQQISMTLTPVHHPYLQRTESYTALATVQSLDDMAVVPGEFRILNTYPNPFNPLVTVDLEIPEFVKDGLIAVYDLSGKEISRLHEGQLYPGVHSFSWDGTAYASGVYVLSLTAGHIQKTSKLTLLK